MTLKRALGVTALALGAGFWSACTGSAAVGIDAYEQGRYPEALAALRHWERSRGAEVVNDARYALYRGLTELALGNAAEAHLWLSVTQELLAKDPDALDRHDRGRLAAAWQTLGKMPAQLR